MGHFSFSAVLSGRILPSGFFFLILNALGQNYLSPPTFSKGNLVFHAGVLPVPFLDKVGLQELGASLTCGTYQDKASTLLFVSHGAAEPLSETFCGMVSYPSEDITAEIDTVFVTEQAGVGSR